MIGAIDSTGRAFSVQAADIPGGKGEGVPLTSLIELAPGATLAHVVDAQPGRRYLFANSAGYGFIATADDLLTRLRAGKAFMTIEDGEEVLRPAPVPEAPQMAVALSEGGRMLLFPAHELREIARGRGIMLMGLDPGEKLAAVGFADGKSVTITGRTRSGAERSVKVAGAALAKHILHRARKGCQLPGKLVPLMVGGKA
jgi:topoisomerase-4 subunit A